MQYVFGKPGAAAAYCGCAGLRGCFVLKNQLKEGDLVFFSTYEPGASHVGIYAEKACSGMHRRLAA
ncbi:MAG: NlpC/P60 family protein [Phascolarctobacterium faecium]